jgi:hypothetical protein
MKKFVQSLGVVIIIGTAIGCAGFAGGTAATTPSTLAYPSSVSATDAAAQLPATKTSTQTRTAFPPSATATKPTTTTRMPSPVATKLIATSVPPTATQSATATLSPTNAPPKATQADVLPVSPAAHIQAALAKNRALTSYRGLIVFHIGGAQFLDWTGEIAGQNAHFSFISDWYLQDREMIVVGDKAYYRSYSHDSKSYVGEYQSEAREEQKHYIQSPRQLIEDAVGDPAQYVKTGTQEQDGLTCDVYTSEDKVAIARNFLTATQAMGKGFTLAEPGQAEEFAKGRGAEKATVLVCADGYIHTVILELDRPDTPASESGAALDKITFGARLGDPNANIEIKTP